MPYLGALIQHHIQSNKVSKLLYIGQPWSMLNELTENFSNLEFKTYVVDDLLDTKQTQRLDLVILKTDTRSPKHCFQQALGLSKNLLSEKIWLYDEAEIFEFSDLIAMGLKKDTGGDSETKPIFSYNLQNYNKKRDWNNPKNWANPHRWHIRF